MITKPLSLLFIESKAALEWKDVSYGFTKGWLGWKDVVELASRALSSPVRAPELVDLASATKESLSNIPTLLKQLSERFPSQDDPASKWFFLCLAWLYENESKYADPLAEVEGIAAEFGYPAEAYEMLRSMPAQGAYNPTAHIRRDNLA